MMRSLSRPASLLRSHITRRFSKIILIKILFLEQDNAGGSPPSGPGFNYYNCLDLETSFDAEFRLVTACLIRVTAPLTDLWLMLDSDWWRVIT